jgi:glycosyltransferase involved in cell wall biosynthesis
LHPDPTQPRLSLIIPTRNCKTPLQRLLSSIRNQTYRNFEVIIVDNFSTDGTFELAGTFTAKAFQQGPERHKQRVFGASQAEGEYVLFFDSDMELDTGLLADCVRLAAAGHDAAIIPERGGGEGFWANCQKLEKECYWNDPHMEAANRFIRKSMYDMVGGYDVALIAGEDFDLHDKLLSKGARIGRTTAMLTHYEDARFWRVVRKKFYYGSKMSVLFQRSPGKNIQRFSLIKPAFVRNWRKLLSHPVLTTGLVLMKTTQFLAGFLGMCQGCVFNRKPAGNPGT